jgi:uncharacterized iron-regulated membrane protein
VARPRPWRPALLKVHRWLALTAGLLLLLNAVTGTLLLAARPLDRALNPDLFSVVPGTSRVSLESLRQSLVHEFGIKASLTLRPPRQPDASLNVSVRNSAWEGQVYFNPYTGARLGARGKTEGWVNTLFEFHSALLSGEAGKRVLAFDGLIMLGMLVTGYLLWWPIRWRGAFRVTLNAGTLRALLDLHRFGGAVLGLWVLVCVASGTWMAWRPISQWVTQAAGQTPVVAPAVPLAKGEAMTVDQLLARADAALPGGVIGSIQLPAKPTAPVRVRKKLPDDPHPNGLSSIWLNPRSGEVLQVDRWDALDVGAKLFAWIYPLHAGQLAGALGVLATAAGGLLLTGFGVSGTWLWWLRRRMR